MLCGSTVGSSWAFGNDVWAAPSRIASLLVAAPDTGATGLGGVACGATVSTVRAIGEPVSLVVGGRSAGAADSDACGRVGAPADGSEPAGPGATESSFAVSLDTPSLSTLTGGVSRVGAVGPVAPWC